MRIVRALPILVSALVVAGCAGAPATAAPATTAPTAPRATTPAATTAATATAAPTTAAPTPAPTTAPPTEAPTPEPTEAATEAPTAAASDVTIASFKFSPAELVVQPGTTVTWTNLDGTSHTVKFDGGPESPVLQRGNRYQRSFDAAGTFPYICGIHPSMEGAIRVEG